MNSTHPIPDIEIEPPSQPRSFLTFLAEQQSGALVSELSKELRDITEAIEEQFDQFRGKVTGSLTINVKLTLEKGIYRVDIEYASRRPRAPAASTIMWLGRDGNLNTQNPNQLNLPFSSVKEST